MAILEVEHLKKIYTTRLGSNRVEALKDVNFTVERGEFVAIMGESGSGKTTLLNLLAALDKPTGGQVRLNGKNLGELKEKEIAGFRRENLGFVFQDFNLLDTFSLRDNIYLPLVLEGKKYEEMSLRAEPIAKKLGITQILRETLPAGAAIPANRGELALLLWNAADKPEPKNQPAFTDVSDPETAKAAQWAIEAGLMETESSGKFAPAKRVTRLKVFRTWKAAKH